MNYLELWYFISKYLEIFFPFPFCYQLESTEVKVHTIISSFEICWGLMYASKCGIACYMLQEFEKNVFWLCLDGVIYQTLLGFVCWWCF